MAKRFIDTEIWDKEKFCSSSDKQKLLTLFITSKCDQIGVFKMANMLITAYIGSPVTKEDILSIPVDIIELSEGKYWLVNFCKFQYGELKETCKPHKKYIEMLKSEGLFERVSKGYPKGIHTLQEKEKEKEEEKDKEKESYKNEINEVLDHLNNKLGSKFRTAKGLKKRFSEGFTVEDAKKVIDIKFAEWIGDDKMKKYIRPDTLFSEKFDSYLNQEQQPQQEENPWGLL